MDKKIRVVGYGSFKEDSYDGILLETTKRLIWLETEHGKQQFRIRDGKKVGADLWSGYEIHPEDLIDIPGRRRKR